ncbi:hypothetical protein Q1M62_21705 [Sinorhizobium meliloti]|nr:hypothetical protein LZK74_22980 [Sinorhizobium meliloti]WKL32645.1 hypothetical protein Q1M65_22115 [Sinorhizobium meliloti]WKL38411.1 hypothetical protein Q1M62_21705 [Sinorhizobium meliloti]
MNWWLKVFAHVVALAMFGLMSYAAFVQPSGAWPLAVAAIFIVFIANLDRFSEISASTSGISATVREAKSKIAELKNMIQLTAEFQMHALQSANRWGGAKEERYEYFLQNIKKILRDADFNETEVSKIQEEFWDTYVKFDYAHHILGGAYIPKSDDKALMEEWESLRSIENTPSSETIRKFLQKHGEENELREQFLDAYEYYEKNQRHKDFDLWKRRSDVPPLFGKHSS